MPAGPTAFPEIVSQSSFHEMVRGPSSAQTNDVQNSTANPMIAIRNDMILPAEPIALSPPKPTPQFRYTLRTSSCSPAAPAFDPPRLGTPTSPSAPQKKPSGTSAFPDQVDKGPP